MGNVPTEYAVARLKDLPQAPAGELLRVPLFSPAMGLRRWFGVWIPPQFKPQTRYPVAYLFRGHHREWMNPTQDASREQVLSDLVGRAIAAAELPPTILIFPCFSSDDATFQTICADWLAEGETFPALSGVGLGRFETHFLRELVPALEDSLGLLEPHRIGIGFSLGGLNVFTIAFRQPGFFREVAAYDGSFFLDPPTAEDTILGHPMFRAVFGKPKKAAQVKSHSPIWLAKNLPYQQLERSRYYLQSGPEEAEPDDSNYERTRALIEALAGRNLPNQFHQVVRDGRHNWATADRFALRVLSHVLSSS